MKTKFNRILTLLLAFVVHIAFAQERTISGVVSDETGPLPGVSILKKGTSTGTETDFDGNYSIKAKKGDILVFSFVGMKSKSITVSDLTTVNVIMENDNVLDEVIVTAQGIKKEKKALGYAVSVIKTEEIEQKADTDIGKILRGKAAGVRITGAGGATGSGSNIIIRGFSTITGSNQPLFIVDGVPFDNSSGGANNDSSSSQFQSGNNRSGFADIDPNNIASVSVLKGLSATTIYGSRGNNGVILITTKSGSKTNKKFEVNLSQSTFSNNIVLPDYQDTWGNGFYNSYGAFFSNWGSRFDSQETIDNAFRTSLLNNFDVEPSTLFPDRTDLDAETVEYKPHDSQKDFFRTGFISTTSINASASLADKGNVSFSFGHVDDKSFIPGNELERTNFSISSNINLSNKFRISGKLNYSDTYITSPFADASTGSDVAAATDGTGGIASIWNVLYLPRSVDLTGAPYQNPLTGESIWYRGGNDRTNPLWVVDNTKDTSDTSRFFGNLATTYLFSDNVNLMYRFGLDNTNTNSVRGINGGSGDGLHPNGYLQTTSLRTTLFDHSLLLNIDKDLSEDINLTATFGGNSRRREVFRDGTESRDQIIFGLLNHINFSNSSNFVEGTLFADNNTTYLYEEAINELAVFSTATFSYKDYLYLTGAVRNEWNTTLEPANQSQFAPSASLSFIPTSAFEDIKSPNGFNYLKLRVGYGTAPGYPDAPYTTRLTTNLTPNIFEDVNGNGTTTTNISRLRPNPDLKPQLTKEFEIGIESRLFKNRFGFDFTYYNRDTQDLINQRPLPPESGFTSEFTNIGNVVNKGIELSIDGTPIKNENFEWKITGNFSKNTSEVQGLDDGEQILYGGLFSSPRNAAINGEQLGVIFGSRVLRDDDGNRLIGEDGYWIQDPNNGIIGDPNPDWFSTISNNIRWKNLTLNFQIEYQHGGDMLATTIGTLIGRGLVEDTDFDRTQGIVLPGVRQSTGNANDIQISATDAYFNNIGLGTDELLIYDMTHIRLREASLTYNIPTKFIEKTPFGKVSLSLIGQNLFVRAFNTPPSINYDPELNSLGVGNSQGFDYLTSWNSRRFGASVKLTF